jgi:hypothetical protein
METMTAFSTSWLSCKAAIAAGDQYDPQTHEARDFAEKGRERST